MTRFEVSDDKLEVEQSSRFYSWGAIFFLVFGSLVTVVGVVSLAAGHDGGGELAQGITGVIVGVVFGAMPRQRVLVATRASDELVWRQRTLFSRREMRVPLRDITAVVVIVGYYWKEISIARRDDASLICMAFLKSWVWNTDPGPQVLDYGRRLAGFLRVPLEAGAPAVAAS